MIKSAKHKKTRYKILDIKNDPTKKVRVEDDAMAIPLVFEVEEIKNKRSKRK